jgi:glycosyltransferase involved in cell wall biosynthesis
VRVLLDVSAVPDRPVGAGVYTIALANGLGAHDDIDLQLLARRNDAVRWADIAPGATVHAQVPPRRPLRLAWEQTRARGLVKAVRPDVWHGPHYTLPLRVDARTVVTVHDCTFFDHPEWHERSKVAYFRRMIRAAVARADVVVCVSEYTASRLRAHCSPRGDIVVVPHGVDHTRFRLQPAAPDDDLAQLSVHGVAPPYIAFAGTLEPRKDLPNLVQAFAVAARDRPDLRLVLAGGDGWGTTAVRDAIAGSGVATQILRTGYLDNATVAALFRHAEIVAYPSLEEGFGLNALEAMACGTPLVSTRGSAIEEVVGDAGLLVPPHDTRALAGALVQLLDDEELQRRLRRAGPARAAEFTWTRSVNAHVDVYRRAAAAVAV